MKTYPDLMTYDLQNKSETENLFAERRDLAIAAFIPMALTFPKPDPSTGYGIHRNSLARLVGLLHCHHKIHSAEELQITIDRCTQQLRSVDGSPFIEELKMPRWMLRHAQTSLETVQTNLLRGQLLLQPLAAARHVIDNAEKVDLPKLIALVGEDASQFTLQMIGRSETSLRLGEPV